MSHEINYLIEIPGNRFNKLLQTGAPADDPDRWHWEDFLACSSMPLTVNLSGLVTLLWIPLRFSRLLDDTAGEIAIVRQWERCLLETTRDTDIYRIDNLLIREWEAEYGFDWITNETLANAFLVWLESQDHLHWKKLPDLID